MRRIMRHVLTGVTAAAVLALATGAPAHADPGHARAALGLQIGCDDGTVYAAVTTGRGRFTPAHDVSSTAVLVPVRIGRALVTVLDPKLNVVDQWTTPAWAKPRVLKHHKKSLTRCTVFGFAPRADGSTVTLQGTLVGFVTPRR